MMGDAARRVGERDLRHWRLHVLPISYTPPEASMRGASAARSNAHGSALSFKVLAGECDGTLYYPLAD
eukprot:scaffold25857_cov101-Isochrysis_galbana.AAC.3